MIAAGELYPEHEGEYRVRREDDRWAELRVSGQRSLGPRAGTAKWTLFNGWSRRLSTGLDDELRFILVPERALPLRNTLSIINSANIFAFAFAGLFFWCVLNRSWVAVVFGTLLAGYYVLLRRVVHRVHARRRRTRDNRLKAATGGAIPKWIESQQLVAASDTELNQGLLDWIESLSGETLGYEFGVVCAHGSAWLLADDPQGLGPPPELTEEKARLPGSTTSPPE